MSRTRKHALPALSSWNRYAGGTSAAEGKHSYDFYTGAIRDGGRQYSISPYTTKYGRHAGYLLSVFPGRNHGHAGIAPDGREIMHSMRETSYRSPQAAVTAARKYEASRKTEE